jgi:hypothetical protein
MGGYTMSMLDIPNLAAMLDLLKTLEKHKLVSFMHQNSGGQEVWLNLLASVAAWAAPILDRISDFFPLYTPHNYSLHISTVIDTLDWIMPDTRAI